MIRPAPPSKLQVLAAVGAAGVALGAAGCSVKQVQNADLVTGKRLFVAKCSSCHTLARANAKGVVGPNLDEAFGPAISQGLKRSTIRGAVHDQILFPERGGVMPAKLVTGTAVDDVAAYVAYAAARSGQDTGLLATAGGAASGPAGVFVAQGCGGCHTLKAAGTSGTLGPDLDKYLKGKTAAFIRTQIVTPDTFPVPGFPTGVMPRDFARKLSKNQLDALVAFLAGVTR